MNIDPQARTRTPEPRGMTLADLGVLVAGVALVMTLPARTSAWPPFLPPPQTWFFALIGGLRLAVACGMVLALVVLFRRGRYGGTVRPAEYLALALAAFGLLDVTPGLDDAVNACFAPAAFAHNGFSTLRWLLAAPAIAGVVLIAAGVLLLRRRVRAGSRVAAAITVAAIVGGLLLWFWGPCQIAQLELPWLLVPSPRGDPAAWGWRGPVVLALREMIGNGPVDLTWGMPAAAAVRRWRNHRRGTAPAWVWTEGAAILVIVAAAASFLLLAAANMQGPAEIVQQFSWVLGIGLLSWWISGRFDAGRNDAGASVRQD
jgi:hypothetical protein